jgi:histidine ammonia-lyase
MIAQYTAAGIVTRLRHAAAPFAVHNATTSAGQEDHVSMGHEAALRTRDSVAGLRSVLAVELMCAAQALDLRAPLQPAPATAALRGEIRHRVAHLDRDRVLAGDLAEIEAWLASDGCSAALDGIVTLT